MKTQKTLFGIVLVSLVCSLVIGCTSDGVAQSESQMIDAQTSTTETAEPSDGRPPLNIPEGTDYNGAEFRVLTYEVGAMESGYDQARNYSDLIAESENGERINDAVFRRNTLVEELLNIDLITIPAVNEQMTNTIIQDIQSGDAPYDTALQMIRAAQNIAADGYLFNLYDVSTLHLDMPWWDQNLIKGVAMSNNLYVITGDATIQDKEAATAVIYNNALAATLDMDDIFETVDAGKWTLDEMWARCKAATADLDGDGKIGLNDRIGTGSNYTSHKTFMNGADIKFAYLENGKPVSGLESERSVTFIQKLAEFMNDKTATIMASNSSWDLIHSVMANGRMLCSSSNLYSTADYRNVDFDYCLIPTPKYDETQENYCSSTGPHMSTGFVIPATSADPEYVGVVLETMAYHSASTLQDAYINITLGEKALRDERSVALMKQITSSLNYDIGYVFNWGDIVEVMTNSVKRVPSTFTSNYEKKREAYVKAMEETYALFAEES